MNAEQFITKSTPFLNYVVEWKAGLKNLPLAEVIAQHPHKVAVISVDIINGFCYDGPLSSPRVANLVEPIARLFEQAHQAGIGHFILTEDNHPADAVEFANFPPHCVRQTAESDTVARFKELPFFNLFRVIPKRSLNSIIGTDLEGWLEAHPEVDTFITVGDCTDLCTYQLAMHLKLRANARNEKARVVLPVNCVDTYDLPVAVAKQIGAIPHDGDLLHYISLYHMMLNGIEIVAELK